METNLINLRKASTVSHLHQREHENIRGKEIIYTEYNADANKYKKYKYKQ